jgi:LytS/YehU family sensor histidine kinase
METTHVFNNSVIIVLSLFITIMLLIEFNNKLKYLFNGKLISEHTINNLLQHAVYLDNKNNLQYYLEKVGSIIRFGYQHSQKMSISLEDELTCCENLVAAFCCQHKKQVKLKYGIPATLMESRIPPYTIGILIENALKHGLNDNKEHEIEVLANSNNNHHLQISLSGYKVPERLVIRKPKKAHGLFYLINRVSYFNYYYGCSYLDAISVKQNKLLLNIAITT